MHDLVAAGLTLKEAFRLSGCAKTVWRYRHHRRPAPPRCARRPDPRALTAEETKQIVDLLAKGKAKDLSVYRIFHDHLDGPDPLIGSMRTFYRVNTKYFAQPTCARPAAAPKAMPVVSATAPGQVLCWDVTWLPQSYFNKGLFLYTVLDLYSRKIVAWTIQHAQETSLAKQLIAKAIATIGATGNRVQVVHSDNGSIMTSNTMKKLLSASGVEMSLIRPGVSNDNPHEESSHRTIKHHRWAKEIYPTIEIAVETIGKIINEYNHRDRHRGLAGFTPQQVFDGSWRQILDHRVAKSAAYYHKNPGRRPRRYGLRPPPSIVGINIGKQQPTTLETRHLAQLENHA